MHVRTDVLIIGDGQAATPLAMSLAQAGRSVAIAERQQLGGSCVNFGCTPTKAAIASARVAHQARHAAEYGVRLPQPEIDFEAVLGRARRIRDRMRGSLADTLGTPDNPQLLHGHARFTGRTDGRFNLQVAEDEVDAGAVVIDTGTRSAIPPIDGLEAVDILDAGNWLERPELPDHVAILGGGYIGLEMAQFYRRMGSRVTVVETGERVLSGEDDDVADAVRGILESEGVEFVFNARAASVARDDGRLRLEFEGGSPGPLTASHLFVATGRQPNTDDLGLETVGVATDDKGFVQVDERLSTNVAGIWAAGDIRGGPMFTHSSWDDGRILRSQLLEDGSDTTLRSVPYAVFTDPQLGRVGMTERQAREAGLRIRTGVLDMASNGKAKEIGEEKGFIKVVVDADDNMLLGATVLSAEGAELVHTYVDLINLNAPIDTVRNAVYIHPTLAEATQTVLTKLEG